MKRIPRIFHPQTLSVDSVVEVEGAAHHRLAHVLRLREGAPVVLFDGSGTDFSAQLQSITRRTAQLQVVSSQRGCPPPALFVQLAIGISKPKYFDLALQKAVELGVSRIMPLISDRSPAKDLGKPAVQEKLAEHWHGVIIGACEQSGRAELPMLNQIVTIDEYCQQETGKDTLRLLLHPDGSPVQREIKAPDSVTLAVGAEGGFSDAEIAVFAAHGYQKTSLGPRILRTETAPMTMLSILQYLWGDLG